MEPQELHTPDIPAPEEPAPAAEPVGAASIPPSSVENAAEPAPASVIPEKTAPTPSPRKKGFGSNLLTWAIIAVVFFIGGLVTMYFAYTRPAQQAAAAAEEVNSQKFDELTAQFNQAIKQVGDTQTQLDLTKGELQAANVQIEDQARVIEDQAATIARVNQLNIAYKFLGDVNSARVALERNDVATARQSISFARADLKTLEATGLQADALAGFSTRLDEAIQNIDEPTLVKSRAALDSLHAGILLLIDNIP